MTKKLFVLMLAGIFSLLFASAGNSFAQNRKAVGAAEVNGTFRDYFEGKNKGSYNEIKILALGKGKLKISFELIYPYRTAAGEMTANMGSADGEALIEGDRAVFTDSESAQCKIAIKFVKPGTVKVTHETAVTDCGFGFNVSADGTYKKTSGAKPKFESAAK